MTGITLLRIISPTLIWENISLSFEIVFEILIKVIQVIFFENTLENKESKKEIIPKKRHSLSNESDQGRF